MIGVIGGSGIYQVEGLEKTRWEKVETPFGAPSDELLFGELAGVEVVFLPRHGRGHRIPPNEVNYRANIDALKRVGVTDIVSLSAVGSLKEDLAPGTFVVIDQLIDRTFSRQTSFFGTGLVAHVSMAHPVCARIGDLAYEVGLAAGATIVRGGTLTVMEGPQFSSLAESRLHQSWGCDLIGMTALPEAKLAREAEICYATVAMVTDYDCWHPDHDHVSVEDVVAVMHKNGDTARRIVQKLVPLLASRPAVCPHRCDRALDTALMTAPDARDPALIEKLSAIVGRVLGAK